MTRSGKKKRMNQTMVEKRAFICDECKRRTIDKVSCATSQIEHAAFRVAKGSSQRSKQNNNLYSSRLGNELGMKLDASTISQ